MIKHEVPAVFVKTGIVKCMEVIGESKGNDKVCVSIFPRGTVTASFAEGNRDIIALGFGRASI